LAEATALLLLQQVALVAPVPRTEDVGVDAVVTLHRAFDQRRLIAEDSLFVQIKSASVDAVEYSAEEVKWLYDLDLPLFYASFDMTTCQISLFCAQQLAEAFITNHDRKKLLVRFDGEPDMTDIVGASDDIVRLGPPVMVWSMRDCSTDRKGIREKFYTVLKAHVRAQKRNLEFRSVGRVENYVWRTNEVPPEGTWKTTSTKPKGEILSEAYDRMMPYFSIWVLELPFVGNWEHARDVMSLLEKTRELCEAFDGANPAPRRSPGPPDRRK
jgi:hypothetical protein